jgi:hypothetical protein
MSLFLFSENNDQNLMEVAEDLFIIVKILMQETSW